MINMKIHQKEFVLDELREHTSDCDTARSQHFYMESKYRKWALALEIVKSAIFLTTVAGYVIFVAEDIEWPWLTAAILLLSVISTILEMGSYMLRLDDKAAEHWKAAQMYSELYRKCQFFCSDYADGSIEVWREKLRDISEELSRLALMSPGLSKRSYTKGCVDLSQKKYPVHKAMVNHKMIPLDEVMRKIKEAFNDSKIEIYIFGSYLTSLYSNDIDIAVIWHSNQSYLESSKKMNIIESEYAIYGLNLDITVITEDDIVANRCTQFIKNISEGECYYKSLDVQKCLQDYEIALSDYSGMIRYFLDILDKHIQSNERRAIVENLFYLYYHMLSYILSKFHINWYGERSILNESDILAASKELKKDIGIDSNQLRTIIQHARISLDKKNRLFNSATETNDTAVFKKYFEYDKPIISACVDYLDKRRN